MAIKNMLTLPETAFDFSGRYFWFNVDTRLDHYCRSSSELCCPIFYVLREENYQGQVRSGDQSRVQASGILSQVCRSARLLHPAEVVIFNGQKCSEI